jgi:hypothetical protein
MRVALVEVGLGEWKVKCEAYHGLTLKEEAQLFVKRNYQALPSAYDRHKAGRAAEDEVVLALDAIAQQHGLHIGNEQVDSCVRCVTALRKVYGMDGGGPLLGTTLGLLIDAWGLSQANFEGRIVEGVALVLARNDGKADLGVMAHKLSKYAGGPTGLIGTARGLRHMNSKTVSQLVASVVVSWYNRGRTKTRLEDV